MKSPLENSGPSDHPASHAGKVVALFLHEAHGAPPRSVEDAIAITDRGLQGDSHARSPSGGSRQVLVVSVDDLAAVGLQPGNLREQITVDLPGLMDLPPGTLLEIGEAALRITRDCEPCTHIGELLERPDRDGFRRALTGHRGMLAKVEQVSSDGRVAVGDPVRVARQAGSLV
jgi:MOSC domain-containing protein YiiM